MICYFKNNFSKSYLSLNGFQRNVFLRFLKLTSLCFLGFSKSTGVSYRGVSYNRILSVFVPRSSFCEYVKNYAQVRPKISQISKRRQFCRILLLHVGSDFTFVHSEVLTQQSKNDRQGNEIQLGDSGVNIFHRFRNFSPPEKNS